MKIYKYHTSHSYIIVKYNKKVSTITQLYQIGIYGIINSDPSLQFSMTPSELVALEKKLIKDRDKGIIKDLEFGREIKVTEDKDGFWTEIKQ